MFDIGLPEILMLLIIVLLLFGPGRLPKLARALGEAVNEFKSALSEGKKPKEKKKKKLAG